MIPRSMLDDDLYKFTMAQAICLRAPRAMAKYTFVNRGNNRVPQSFAERLRDEVDSWGSLLLGQDEAAWMRGLAAGRQRLPYFQPWYVDYLSSYRYKPEQVSIAWQDGNLQLEVRGPWYETSLWEVKLMYTICELYFKHADADWTRDGEEERLQSKIRQLGSTDGWGCFSTRRRRDFDAQEIFVANATGKPSFIGTSNCHLAMRNGIRPLGTVAHEWTQGMSALHGIRHANRYALDNWQEVYPGELAIALPDTFGTPLFFRDFDARLARLYDGVRHDSGCPFEFTDRVVSHYQSLGINPETKTIIFSNGLDVETAIAIASYCRGKIRCYLCIGTHFSNDFRKPNGDKSSPLNIVIKLTGLNDIPVVKLSDDPGKAIGDMDAIRIARHFASGVPLDRQEAL